MLSSPDRPIYPTYPERTGCPEVLAFSSSHATERIPGVAHKTPNYRTRYRASPPILENNIELSSTTLHCSIDIGNLFGISAGTISTWYFSPLHHFNHFSSLLSVLSMSKNSTSWRCLSHTCQLDQKIPHSRSTDTIPNTIPTVCRLEKRSFKKITPVPTVSNKPPPFTTGKKIMLSIAPAK